MAAPEILVELGSGSSEKTRLLLEAGTRHGTLHTYVPQDVSVSALQGAAEQIGAEFPALPSTAWSATSPSRCITFRGAVAA